jgi:hypothetical protein
VANLKRSAKSMAKQANQTYIEPTQESGRAFFTRKISDGIVMLNLLRFRAVADYSGAPQLAPSTPTTGEEAYRLYMDHTLPHLTKSGGEIMFFGTGGQYLIGPSEERWDAVMLVRQSSAAAFMAFASNPDCMAGIGHRTAALEDSRLLPLVENCVADVLTR